MKKLTISRYFTLKTLCVILFSLFLATNCNPEPPGPPDPPDPKYPIDVPFTEYSLAGTQCQWTNLGFDGKEVIVINSREELEKYITCTGSSYPEVDFAKQTLLLVSGATQNGVYTIIEKVEKLSPTRYKLDIMAVLNDDKPDKQWNRAVVISKLQKDNSVELHLTTIAENIENLYDQPLEVIQATVLGKWQFAFFYCELGYILEYGYPTDAFVKITNNEVFFTGEPEQIRYLTPHRFLCSDIVFSYTYCWERMIAYI